MAISSPCPIEMEPKTLNPGQINHAKEIAGRIAQKMEPPEALDFLIKGLRHGSSDGLEEIGEESVGDQVVDSNCGVDLQSSKEGNNNNDTEIVRQCSCSTRVIDSPGTQRAPLTAPF